MKIGLMKGRLQAPWQNKMVLNHIIISGSVLVVVTILFNILLYFYFNNVVKDFYAEYVQIQSTQVINKMSDFKLKCTTVATQILNDKDILVVLYKDREDVLSFSSAQKTMDGYKAYNDISLVVIYDEKTKTVIRDSDMQHIGFDEYVSENPDIVNILDSYANNNNFLYTKQSSDSSSPRGFIVYVFEDYRGYYLIMHFSEEYFRKKIFSTDNPLEYSTTLYYKDRIVSVNGNSDNIAEISKIKKEAKQRNDIFTITDSEEKLIYIFTQKENYSCLSSISYADVFNKAKRINYVIWIAAVFVLLFEFIILFFISGKFKVIIQEHNKSKMYMQKQNNVLKIDKAIYCLFNKQSLGDKDKAVLAECFGADKKCRLITIFLENIPDTDFDDFDDFEIYEYGIINIFEEIFSSVGICKAVGITSRSIGAILAFEDHLTDEDIQSKISELKNGIDLYIELSFSMIISKERKNIYAAIDNVSEYFKLQRYRFVAGLQSVLFENDVPVGVADATYPHPIQRRIMNAINENDTESFDLCLKEFAQSIIENNFDMAQEWILTLLVNITKVLPVTVDYNLVNRLVSCNTLEESMEILKNIVYPQAYYEKKQSDPFADICDELFKSKFDNPDFSINDLSDKLDITPVYAGYKFKKMFNKTFNQFLAEYRISVAREMLKKQNNKISDIANACGFRSSAYFVTVFKKNMHMTPQEYRIFNKNISDDAQ